MNIFKKNSVFWIFLLALILRLVFLSNFLEDWDSAQFALSLHHYSLINELPHPPGYPLYILLGRLFLIFTQNDNLALSLISAIFGALTVFPIFFITKELFNKKVAFLSTILTILVPVHWNLSEVALTNIPALLIELLIFWGFYHFRENKRALIFLFGLGGLSLGFRFTEFSILISLMGLMFWRIKSVKFTFLGLLSFLIGLSIWLIPLIAITGLSDFIKAYTNNALYIFHHDSQLNQTLSIKSLIKTRVSNVLYLLNLGYTPLFILLSLFSIIFTLFKYKIREFEYLFIFIWLISYLIPLLFFFNLQVTRYTLPLLPPLVIIISLTLTEFSNKNKVSCLVFIFLCLFVFNNALSQAYRFKYNIPPIISGVNYVNKNFSSKDTLIISTYTKRHLEYYGSSFILNTPDQLTQVLNSDPKTIITDTDTIKDNIIQHSNYRLKEDKIFTGDMDIYPRTPKVTIYVLQN